MKMNELADSALKLLCAQAALPATGQMSPDPFHAASRQLAIRRENQILISRMGIPKPHTSPLSRRAQGGRSSEMDTAPSG